ncbi:MAG: hypothetical protein PHW34_11440 [Hespellia sp.]|nr:hypothetical protein [Hespellia sp.]
MDKKWIDRLFLIASIILLIVGVVFLCVSIFGNYKTTTPLAISLGCILLSNFLNVIKQIKNKKN